MNEMARKDLVARIYKDKEFLKSCNLMDYSLLLIFFKEQRDADQDMSRRNKSVYMNRNEEADEI